MSTTQTRLLDGKSVNSIMRKRTSLPTTMVGRKVVFTIQGDGNKVEVLDKAGNPVLSTLPGQSGFILEKKIFNLKANSQMALSNERTISYLKAGAAAEKAGDMQAAHESYNQFLNSCQVSFGIILPSVIADKLGNGVDIAATVIEVKTDNGSLLTIDPSTIMVKEPEVLDNGTSFDVAAYIGKAAEVPEVDQFDEMDRAALVAFAKGNPDLKVIPTKGMTDEAIKVALRAAIDAAVEA